MHTGGRRHAHSARVWAKVGCYCNMDKKSSSCSAQADLRRDGSYDRHGSVVIAGGTRQGGNRVCWRTSDQGRRALMRLPWGGHMPIRNGQQRAADRSRAHKGPLALVPAAFLVNTHALAATQVLTSGVHLHRLRPAVPSQPVCCQATTCCPRNSFAFWPDLQ